MSRTFSAGIDKSMRLNPKGKGGFGDHPELINRKGTKKKESLTSLMKAFLENIPEGKEVSYKEVFIRRVYQLAMEGYFPAMKLIWNYIDGLPGANINVTGRIEKVLTVQEALKVLEDPEQAKEALEGEEDEHATVTKLAVL